MAEPAADGPPPDRAHDRRGGLAHGLAAYGLWGLFVLYFPLLAPSSAVEVLVHRILWSLLVCLVLVTATSAVQRRRGHGLERGTVGAEVLAVARRPRDLALLAVAALGIAVNWLVFIHLSASERVVEISLGYYAAPLVSVALGLVLLRERLRPLQWTALGFGAAAVAVLTASVGGAPVLGLVLAVSFGLYGLAKKQVGRGMSAVSSLTVETALLAPLAVAAVVWMGATGRSTFGTEGTGHALLLASSGVVTAVPLLFFGAAARRLPLSTVGMLQYLTPTLQLLLGVLVLHEVVPGPRWVGLALIWVALAVFTVDLVREARAASSTRARAAVLVH